MKSIEFINYLLERKSKHVNILKIIRNNGSSTIDDKFTSLNDYNILTECGDRRFIYHLYRLDDNSWILGCFGLTIPLMAYQAKYIIELSGKKMNEIDNK